MQHVPVRRILFLTIATLSFLSLNPIHCVFGDPDPQSQKPQDQTYKSFSIMEIQGTEQFSSYNGQRVETTGVVTLFTANGNHFWIQDPDGDGNTNSSDGIFVTVGSYTEAKPKPNIGDRIRVKAEVQEQQYRSQLPLTRLRRVNAIEVLSQDNTLPEAVAITDLPNEQISESIAFWEKLEGMLVSFEQARVIAATSKHGEFGMIASADAILGSGYFPSTQHLVIRSLSDDRVDYNPERILVDDSSLQERLHVYPGDQVTSLTGVVDFSYGNYKIQPKTIELNPAERGQVPETQSSQRRGNVVITTFNVENLFDTQDDPRTRDETSTPTAEELETKLTKLKLAIQSELLLPDVIVVQEIENTAILQRLADRVNAESDTKYTAVSYPSSDGRGIEVGFLYDANKVQLTESYLLEGSAVQSAFGPNSASSGREPLIGIFSIRGKEVIIIGNHFKSKGGDDPLYTVKEHPQRSTETQRKAQARAVRTFVNRIMKDQPEALVMVTGDLNDFEFAEPNEGTNHPIGILKGTEGEVQFENLIDRIPKERRFTFIYDANSQVLDHMLVSPELFKLVVGQNTLDFNASVPEVLRSDVSTPKRCADHNPVEGLFEF